MQAIPGEIQFVIAITLLLILITSFVIAFILIHQKHYHKYIQEKEELKNSYHQEILKAQLEMQEQTFRTISQEIHDNIGQVLSLVRLQISTVNPIDLLATEQKITSSKELLDQALDDLRNLSKQLNPEHVSRHPLSGLLRAQLDIIRKAGLHETHFEMHGEEMPLDPGKKLIVFRIAQEALNNVLKHAAAHTISAVLMYLPDKTLLSIKDDGQGFQTPPAADPDSPPGGLGMRNMAYRATLIGAQFHVQSHPAEGTLIQLTLPMTNYE
jgi:signal transduction histidine kinase